MNHESEKTHLGGTALVQFNRMLLKLGFFIKGVPAEGEERIVLYVVMT